MKLIIAILRDIDHDAVSQALTSAGFRVTLIASTGGFWRRGQSLMQLAQQPHQSLRYGGVGGDRPFPVVRFRREQHKACQRVG